MNTSQAHISNYHPSRVEFLGIGSITWAIHLLAHLVDRNDVSPEEKHDGSTWIELWDEVSYWLEVRVIRCSTGCRNFHSVVRDIVAFQKTW